MHTPGEPAVAPAAPRRLGAAALLWRGAAALVFLLLLTAGTLRGSDDGWPFAPMSQYAFAVDLDEEVRSPYVQGTGTDGALRRVPLTAGGVGVERAEVEGQLARFVRDPALLEALAAAHARRHPARVRFAQLELRERVSDLSGGRVVRVRDDLLASWTVPDPRHPLGCCGGSAP
ncbi:hypothetical protein [Kineococcus indalonis]|uniref:hypothetical protein n=1 Tax=Kineococcus indalonis TaxID=2696566 RepID=UPI001411F9AB|nr:hypothetical protein [Kineococcus indalonis]NAZ86929.1 hypothetical protein [Kineococcus indalonis]